MRAVKQISSLAQSGPTLPFPGLSTGRPKGDRRVVRASEGVLAGRHFPPIHGGVDVALAYHHHNSIAQT